MRPDDVTAVILVCLAVCHGRPLTPTVRPSTVPSGYFPDPAPLLSSGTPLTAVNTPTEESTTTLVTTESARVSPTVISSPTVLPSTVPSAHFPAPAPLLTTAGILLTAVTTPSEESNTVFAATTGPSSSTVTQETTVPPLADLVDAFDLDDCAPHDTTCYFAARCLPVSGQSSAELRTLPAAFLTTASTQEQERLRACPITVLVKRRTLELRRVLGRLEEDEEVLTLAEFGLTIDRTGQVRCVHCDDKEPLTMELNGARTDTFTLRPRPRQNPTNRAGPSTTLWSQLPLPSTPSLLITTDHPTDMYDESKPDTGSLEEGPSKAAAGIAIIVMISLIVFMVVALIIGACRSNRKLPVQPSASPRARGPSPAAWTARSHTSSKSRSSATVTAIPEMSLLPTLTDETEDYEERTPAAASVRTTVSSCSLKPLLPSGTDAEMPTFSARAPSPWIRSVRSKRGATTSKEDQRTEEECDKMLESPATKRAKFDPNYEIPSNYPYAPRTPAWEKHPAPPSSSTYEEVSGKE